MSCLERWSEFILQSILQIKAQKANFVLLVKADHLSIKHWFLILDAGDEPLYSGAPISCRESWTTIYKFAVSNRLTDSATKDLLKLISNHCPDSSRCPQTLYKLKKVVGSLECISYQYCSVCMEEIPLREKKCGKCIEDSQICYYTILPFEEHLKEIFVGKHYSNL